MTIATVTIDQDYAIFQRKVRLLTGLDLASYKSEQMRRRLGTLMTKIGVGSFTQYAAVLARDPVRLQEFRDFITINVSEFYRDAAKWADLRTYIARLTRSRPNLRVWSAGCSIGAEPYSLAMMLAEVSLHSRHTIAATDIDQTILARAQQGNAYLEKDLRNVPAPLRARWMRKMPDETWSVVPELRSQVAFRPHDLLADPYPTNQDVIVCRNVVIYFTDEAKTAIYRRFASSLRSGGLLFVGATEVIMNPHDVGLRALTPSFYAPRHVHS